MQFYGGFVFVVYTIKSVLKNFVEKSDSLIFVERDKMRNFSVPSSSKIAGFSIEALILHVNSLLPDFLKVERRKNLRIIAVFVGFRLSRFYFKHHLQEFSHEIFVNKSDFLDMESFVYGELRVWKPRKYKTSTVCFRWTVKLLDPGEKTFNGIAKYKSEDLH